MNNHPSDWLPRLGTFRTIEANVVEIGGTTKEQFLPGRAYAGGMCRICRCFPGHYLTRSMHVVSHFGSSGNDEGAVQIQRFQEKPAARLVEVLVQLRRFELTAAIITICPVAGQVRFKF